MSEDGEGRLSGGEGCHCLDTSRNLTMTFRWWLTQERKGRQRVDLTTRHLAAGGGGAGGYR